MILSISLYFIILFLIWWAYCGYLFAIYLLSLFSDTEQDIDGHEADMTVSILVPCYNEENYVKRKVENLKAIAYPKDKLKIYFLDGTSTDSTVSMLRQEIQGCDHMQVIDTGTKGKINQLNQAIHKLETDIIMNTDMDAMLNPDVLAMMVKGFCSNPEATLIGACVYPDKSNSLDQQYWETQNWFRIIESRVISSSIVVAPCYAFRRGLITAFPEDCVADDIYISFLNNTMGRKTIYLEGALAYEGRNPAGIDQMITHKFRKANAYITELLRFLYLIPRMEGKWKMIYLTKLLQVVVVPWLFLFFAMGSLSFLLSGPGTVQIVVFSMTFLFVSFLACHFIVKKNVRTMKGNRYKKRFSASIFMLTNLILILAGITYPFYIQNSNYNKVKEV
ncbi:MAG: glycosyltransferase [Deltaproteobacteria bacterium]|nr:glycosyltransferase [Deltaproteobacteria bacterium]